MGSKMWLVLGLNHEHTRLLSHPPPAADIQFIGPDPGVSGTEAALDVEVSDNP